MAACSALGYTGIGIEINKEYADMAREAVPKLASLEVDLWKTGTEDNNTNRKQNARIPRGQPLEGFQTNLR
jgi:DNA modification methylase